MYSLLVVVAVLIPFCLCESHYSVLGISKNAKAKEIKKAYVKLAYEWHPDKNKDPEAPDMMAKINRAYEVLSDEDKRRHYDLIEDDSDYLTTRTSSFTSSSYEPPSGEPTDEINTKEFVEDVLPASRTTPYLIYFFHDFCVRCEDWTEILENARKDLQLIGVKMASINVIVSSKVATYCNVYIHEVPRVVLLVNKKTQLFKGFLDLDNLKDFVYRHMPTYTIKQIDYGDFLSVESRVDNNKPVVLLSSPRLSPSLNYRIVSFTYQAYLDFYFISSAPEKFESNRENLNLLNLTQGDKLLRIYSDLQEPVVVLEGESLNREATKAALEKYKLLNLPRVKSCLILDELCPDGPNTRRCALLVADSSDILTNEFRSLSIQWSSRKFNMGYLNWNQYSTLMNVTAMDKFTRSSHTCHNEEQSRPILILHRPSSKALTYQWFTDYCATSSDNSRLLKTMQETTLNESAIMDPCFFDVEYSKDSLQHWIPREIRQLIPLAQEYIGKYWEKIGAFISLPLPLLLMSCYLFLFPNRRRRNQQQHRQRNETPHAVNDPGEQQQQIPPDNDQFVDPADEEQPRLEEENSDDHDSNDDGTVN